jgi:NAD(P)-dependent dehydrogenase (short-subunit alcohol dehydrogenase family)
LPNTLAGKTVLITGAARGIGAQTARVAAARGANVSLVGLESERLGNLCAELGENSTWFECDVTDQAAIDQAVAGTVDALGGIDVVVCNAGVANNGTVAVNPPDALTRTIEVNLVGVVRTVSSALPHVTARSGYVLIVSSAAAFTVMPGMAAYCASKAGVEHFANALRLEVAHKGVAVGSAHPAWIDTDLVRDQRAELSSFEEILQKLPGPLGTYTSVEQCGESLVASIEGRKRRVYVPGSLRWVQALRTLIVGPLGDLAVRRQARTMVPRLESEVQALGRSFGTSSVETNKHSTGVPDQTKRR